MLANLICLSKYFLKQSVSTSATQWERPQDNKITVGQPGEGVLKGGVHMMKDPANAMDRQMKPSLTESDFIPCQTDLFKRWLERVKCIPIARKRESVTDCSGKMLFFFIRCRVWLRCQHWLAWLIGPKVKERFGQMIASVGHHLANPSTHTSVAFPVTNGWKQIKPRAIDIYIPPSYAVMIFKACEAEARASSSIVTLNCVSTVCTVGIYWGVRCLQIHSTQSEWPSVQ